MSNAEHYSTYKWIKVKKYVQDEKLAWEDSYYSLDHHHIEETSFLIAEVRKLAKKLDEVQAQNTELREGRLQERLDD